MMPNAAHTPFSLLFSYPFSFSVMDVPGFFIHIQRQSLYSGGEEMFVKTSRRRLTGAEQQWAEEGVLTLGRATLEFSSSPSSAPPLRLPSPGALPSGASSPGREAEPPHRKSEHVYLITIQALPTTTIRHRPTPSPYPHLAQRTHPPTHPLSATPVPSLASLPGTHTILHKGRASG